MLVYQSGGWSASAVHDLTAVQNAKHHRGIVERRPTLSAAESRAKRSTGGIR